MLRMSHFYVLHAAISELDRLFRVTQSDLDSHSENLLAQKDPESRPLENCVIFCIDLLGVEVHSVKTFHLMKFGEDRLQVREVDRRRLLENRQRPCIVFGILS